jgi:hypothetical protein
VPWQVSQTTCTSVSISLEKVNIFAADDLYYGFNLNPAIAIFTLLGSQLLGYGLAGTTCTLSSVLT